MKRIAIVAALLAAGAPGLAQEDQGRLPSETACTAVLERVQLALAQADRGIQAENYDDVERWSAIAAHYSTIHAAFCGDGQG